MANLTVTNVDLNSPILEDAGFRDDILTFTAATTYSAGTILARDSVSAKVIAFVKGGSTNEDGIPKAILTYDVTSTGAGDINIRAGVSGKYRKEKLIILADGDASNVDSVVTDQLRDYNMTPIDVDELNIQDNQ